MAMDRIEAAIRTDRGQYVGGDVIYGSLYIYIPSGCKVSCLKLVIRGHELCEYDYQYVLQKESLLTKIGQRKSRKDLLRVELKLVDLSGAPDSPEGHFAYPFRYQLPHGLPGVFNAKHEDVQNGRVWQGVIKYVIGVLVEVYDAPPELKLFGETSLQVLDSIECSKSKDNCRTMEIFSATGNVKTFFCIHRGDINVTSSLDKLAYTSEDQVKVELQVDNNSAVDVSGSTLKIIRVIKLYGIDKERDDELSSHTIYDTIVQQTHPGCPKNSSKKSTLEINLKDFCEVGVGLPPTVTSGALIKCSYVVDIDVHVPWAPDIEVRLPLTVKPPADEVWEAWQPPEWVNKCTQEQVTGMCAVPRNILASQSFAGMPSFQPIL